MFNSNNLIYIFTTLESIEKIFIYTKDFKDDEEFFYANEQLNFNAVISQLIAIGEESKKIDQGIKKKYSFSWSDIGKLRDKISHNYRGINPYVVWDIVENSLPKYKSILLEILPYVKDYKEALRDALDSDFYKHLSYLK